MLNSKEEFEALTATLNDSGWAIYKRMLTEDMKNSFDKAVKASNKEDTYNYLQEYRIMQMILQKPYNILKESEFNTQGEQL